MNFRILSFALLLASCASNNTPAGNGTGSQSQAKPGAVKQMISRTYYDVKFQNGDWLPADTSKYDEDTYTYNEDGLPVEYVWDAERERVYHIRELFSYKDGKFSDREIYADTMKLKKTIEWENDSSYKEVFFDNNGNVTTEYRYVLNSAQKPLSEKHFTTNGLLSTTHYKYDLANILIEEVDTMLSTPSHTTHKALTRDSFGNPLKTLATKEKLNGPVTRKLIVRKYQYF